MIVCILFVTPALVKYTGKRNLTMYGMFVVVAAQLILLIDPTNVTLVTALAVVKGFGYGPLWGTVFAMLADACEYGQWKFHVRNDAFLFSAGSIGSKLGGGIAAGMVGVVLSICGYDGTAAVQTTQSLNAIYWVYVFLPIVLAAVQIDREYTKLSGGELQLVIIARAIAQQSHLLVMDEPTAHLDFTHELNVMEIIARLVRDKKISIIMATHFLNQAYYLENAGVNTRVALINDGNFAQVGTPSQVLNTENLEATFNIITEIVSNGTGERKYILPLRNKR